MGLRAVSLELLPLALVLGHAVRAPVLELDLTGKNGLDTDFITINKKYFNFVLCSDLAVSFTVSPGQAVVHHSSVGCSKRSEVVGTLVHPVRRHPGALEVILLRSELHGDLAGVRPQISP